jgi:hypothetical protein
LARLLTGIRQALHDQPPFEPAKMNGQFSPRAPDDQERISLPTLINHLKGNPHEVWQQMFSRGDLTWHWVGNQLRNELEPAGTQTWWTGPEYGRSKHTGYYASQFEQAWRRHQIPEPVGAAVDTELEEWRKRQDADFDAANDALSPIAPTKGAAGAAVEEEIPSTTAAPAAPDETPIGKEVPEDLPDSLEAAVLALHEAHPQRSVAWLAKQLGQAKTRVQKILNGGEADQ